MATPGSLVDIQLDRGDTTLQLAQWNDTTKRWVATTNPVGPADGQFGYWVRNSTTGEVTLATAADDLVIAQTVRTRRVLAGGVT